MPPSMKPKLLADCDERVCLEVEDVPLTDLDVRQIPELDPPRLHHPGVQIPQVKFQRAGHGSVDRCPAS